MKKTLLILILLICSISSFSREYALYEQIEALASNVTNTEKVEFLKSDDKFNKFVNDWNSTHRNKIDINKYCSVKKVDNISVVPSYKGGKYYIYRNYEFIIVFEAGDKLGLPAVTVGCDGCYVEPSEDNGLFKSVYVK